MMAVGGVLGVGAEWLQWRDTRESPLWGHAVLASRVGPQARAAV